jgi:hypothetical protein
VAEVARVVVWLWSLPDVVVARLVFEEVVETGRELDVAVLVLDA